MRLLLLSLIIWSVSAFTYPTSTATVSFYEGDFNSAKSKAGEEGKLFFVDFYANWCAPCKWMAESTFKDKEVIDLLDENYVAMKVDIDDLDGYALKQKYQVKILPTIMIFNSKGELVERIEETLSARKMATVLKHHNKKENKVKIQHSVNKSPRNSVATITEEFAESTAIPPAANAPLADSNQETFRVQLGVYKEFENTYNIVDSIKTKFIEPVIVLNDVRNGKVIYRVLMGEFQTKSEANDFKNILKRDHDIQGIVR